MNPTPRQRYTAEFKAQAVELISTGKPVSQIAEELCIGSNLLYKWKQDSQGAQRTTCAPCGAKSPSSRWRMTF
jgi:transposase-like protein